MGKAELQQLQYRHIRNLFRYDAGDRQQGMLNGFVQRPKAAWAYLSCDCRNYQQRLPELTLSCIGFAHVYKCYGPSYGHREHKCAPMSAAPTASLSFIVSCDYLTSLPFPLLHLKSLHSVNFTALVALGWQYPIQLAVP